MKKYTDGFFEINSKNGFLPIKQPIKKLPDRYSILQSLVDELPILKDDKTPGLLSKEGGIESSIKKLPNYIENVKKESDPFICQALFRSYAFLSSAYTLAPAHFTFLKTGKYGKANTTLPKQLAQPFCSVSKKLDVYPWLDYHYAYSLGNYSKFDLSGGFNWENLGMAAKFSGMDDERGFIMLHVDINQYSPPLVESVTKLMNYKNVDLNRYLALSVESMRKINERRQLMWQASRWKHYNDFRVFIMGIKGNDDIFGNGLIYEGVSEKPKQYRGQTGAQDNIIPLMDIFSGIINHYPKNELTHYLKDLRSYRPKCIQNFLEDVRLHFSSLNNSLLDQITINKNFKGLELLLDLLEEIYLFRNGHWQFVQKYIMQNTLYPKATGGTPIISWIPNQLNAVLKTMEECFNILPEKYIKDNIPNWINSFKIKRTLLDKQLELLNEKNYKAKEVYELNKKMNLSDEKR